MILVTFEIYKKCGVTHKAWDIKDDPQLIKYDDLKPDFWFMTSFISLMDH